MKFKNSPLAGNLVVTSEYGQRIDSERTKIKPHTGIDLQAQTPQTVYAVFDGVVVRAGWSDSYGNFIVLKDKASGEAVVYNHLSEITFKDVAGSFHRSYANNTEIDDSKMIQSPICLIAL